MPRSVAIALAVYATRTVSPRKRRYRLTTWPGAPLPLPALWGVDHYKLDPAREDLLVPDGGFVKRQLDGQTVLGLLRLDLDDPEAICAFANRYGVMQTSFHRDDSFDWLQRYLLRKEGDSIWVRPRFGETQLYRELFGSPDGLPSEWFFFFEETLDQFRFGANCLIIMVQAWRFLQGEIKASEVSCRLPLVFPHWSEIDNSVIQSVDPVISVEGAEAMLSAGLTAALTHFHPRLLSRDPYMPEPEPESRKEGVTARQKPPEPSFSLYLLCCLELFNHIVSGATFRECAAEDCNVVFWRQEGRAKFGQHRSDSIYHALTCKNRQAKRNQRRRLRENQKTRR